MALFSQLFSLISSLPALKMQEKPAVTSAEFLASASAFVKAKEMEMLSALSIVPADDAVFPEKSFCGKYTEWEKALRTSILRLRTAKRSDAAEQLARHENVFVCDADSAAARAYAAADPLEREKLLDAARWNKTEELTVNHIFDFDTLCAYYIRLQIAEKWNSRTQGDAEKNLDSAAQKLLDDSLDF